MTIDRPVLGIFLMLGFCVVAPMGDAVAKILGGLVPIGMLLFVRFAVQAMILIPLVALTGRPWRSNRRVFWLTCLRTVLHILGIAAMVAALQFLPLADAVAIAFVMPLILLLLGRYMLGEKVGWNRLIACVVGFIGTLMVIQPSFAEVGWPALLPLGVAVNFALFMLTTRQIAQHTDPVGLQAVSGVLACLLLLPAMIIGQMTGFRPLTLVPADTNVWALLIAIGVLGSVAHLLMTWSLRFAPTTTLAPMQYLEIPVATLIGWLVFQDLPNWLSALGICVTMGAGLFIVLREQAISRADKSSQDDRASQEASV